MGLFNKVKKPVAKSPTTVSKTPAESIPDAPSFERPVSDTILALDIGTEFVKAVIARQLPNHELEIIGVGKAHQAPDNMYAGAIADIPGVVSV